MEITLALIALALALAVAAPILIVARRRRAERGRLRMRDLDELEARIAHRLASLKHPPEAAEETAAFRGTTAPVTVEPPMPDPLPGAVEPEPITPGSAGPEPIFARAASPEAEPAEPEQVEHAPAVPEPVIAELAPEPEPALVPAQKRVPIAAGVAAEPRIPQPGALRPVRRGTAPSEQRPLQRGTLRGALAASAVLVLLVLVGSQVLPALIPHGGSVPATTPTNVAVATASATAGSSATPTPGGTTPPTPGTTFPATPSPVPTPIVYVVRTGDTLWKIADRFNVPLADLIAANPQIADPSKIYAGNLIKIPTISPTASP